MYIEYLRDESYTTEDCGLGCEGIGSLVPCTSGISGYRYMRVDVGLHMVVPGWLFGKHAKIIHLIAICLFTILTNSLI